MSILRICARRPGEAACISVFSGYEKLVVLLLPYRLRYGKGVGWSQRILQERVRFILQGHRIENADLHA